MSDDTQTTNALAERPAKPVDVVRGALERMKPQLAMALPKHLTPDRLVRIAMTAVQRTPKLLDCDKTSFYGAIMTAAQLGLEPDGVLGQAYLIPFAGKVQFIPGYKGLLTLARNSGEISYIAAHEVREHDKFDFDFASGEPPIHKFSLKDDRGDPIAFYAIAKFRDGSFHWDMMTTAEVDLIRDNSSGYQSAKRYAKNGVIDSPWVSNYVEMGKKTAIRRLAKYLPLSVQKAAEIDAQVNAGMHVSLDRYGDIVIEGEAKEVAEDAQESGKSVSKLDRFDERHGNVPRGTEIDAEPEPTADTETRSNDAAASQGAGSDAPTSTEPRPGTPTPAVPDKAATTVSPAGNTPKPQQTEERTAVSADQSAESAGPQSTTTATPAGDLLTPERDPIVWRRPDGKRILLATDPDAFMGEIPRRLQECRSSADIEDLDRHNAALIRKLSADDRMELEQLKTRRREELRAR